MLEFLLSLFSENAVEFKSSEFIRFIAQFDDLTTEGFRFDENIISLCIKKIVWNCFLYHTSVKKVNC